MNLVTKQTFCDEKSPSIGESLYLSKKFSDVTLVVEGKKIAAHRCILACQSEYFEKLLFDNQFEEGKLTELPLDVPLEAFEILLEFLYTGKVVLDRFPTEIEVLFQLLDLSRYFRMELLEQILDHYLVDKTTVENVLEVLDFSVLYVADAVLENCLKCITESRSDILTQDRVGEVLSGTMEVILTSPLLEVATIAKFRALQKWLKQNPECPETTKEKLVSLVDVEKLSNRQISEEIEPSGLFKDTYLSSVASGRREDVQEEAGADYSYSFELLEGEQYFHYAKTFTKNKEGDYSRIVLKAPSPVFSLSFRKRGYYLTEKIQPFVSRSSDGPWHLLKRSRLEDGAKRKTALFEYFSKESFEYVRISGYEVFHLHDIRFGLRQGLLKQKLKETDEMDPIQFVDTFVGFRGKNNR